MLTTVYNCQILSWKMSIIPFLMLFRITRHKAHKSHLTKVKKLINAAVIQSMNHKATNMSYKVTNVHATFNEKLKCFSVYWSAPNKNNEFTLGGVFVCIFQILNQKWFPEIFILKHYLWFTLDLWCDFCKPVIALYQYRNQWVWSNFIDRRLRQTAIFVYTDMRFFQKCENKQSFCLRPPTGLYIIYCLLLCLFSNRPQETSKSEVKISFVLQKFHVICDLLLIRCTPT